MPEEVLFKSESRRSRAEIAAVLRDVAAKLDDGNDITLSAGADSVTLDPPSTPTFEVKAERETSASSDAAELSIEFELEWDEGESGDEGDSGSLTIE